MKMSEMIKMSRAEKAWLAVRLAAFPAATLVPYLVLKIKNLCPVPTDLSMTNCLRFEYPPAWAGWLIVALMAAMVVVSIVRLRLFKGAHAKAYAKAMIKIVGLLVVATTIAYLAMRTHSQGASLSGYSGTVGPDGHSVIELSRQPVFGLGISPSTYFYALILYSVSWAIEIYQYGYSKRKVGGVDTKKLFR